ncbi:DHHW family protein [Leyella lascolaii]|uniref:DHHW family protein n=1 Tax=Leyella lascolaii TaxID=1776379 RepID=UPI00235203C7|nr:DHHW family protein [Leyella lascolaii]
MRHIFVYIYIIGITAMMPLSATGHVGYDSDVNDNSPAGGSPSSSLSLARKTRSGIIVLGSGKDVRAFEPYGGGHDNGEKYANAVNRYKQAFGSDVNVYCMVIPTAVEYYCPDSIRSWTHDERSAIDGIFSHLSDSVVKVDIYDVLAAHKTENIYSRTDHHWAPLGAYYAAGCFAGKAGLAFRDLSSYDSVVVRNYVGTMYTFSKDMAVKNAPEDFVYYVPRGVDYKTTYIKYRLGRNRRVTGESKPVDDSFFLRYNDGSPSAYCTFMGGDSRTVKVCTSTKNGRRLLIMKDSYGNALPGYLFYSFEEIHIIDFRYFRNSVTEYVRRNGISDMLFANNIFHASLESTSNAYLRIM